MPALVYAVSWCPRASVGIRCWHMRTAAGKRRDSGRWKVSFPIGQESSKIDNLTWFQARWFLEYAVWFLGIARNRNRPKEPDRPVEPGRFLRSWFLEYAVWLKSTFFSIPAGTPYLVATALFHLFRAAENFWPFRICI